MCSGPWAWIRKTHGCGSGRGQREQAEPTLGFAMTIRRSVTSTVCGRPCSSAGLHQSEKLLLREGPSTGGEELSAEHISDWGASQARRELSGVSSEKTTEQLKSVQRPGQTTPPGRDTVGKQAHKETLFSSPGTREMQTPPHTRRDSRRPEHRHPQVQGPGRLGNLTRCWWGCRQAAPPRAVRRFLTKLNRLPPWDAWVTLLGIYPQGVRTHVPAETCAQVFPSGLSMAAEMRKPPRRLSAGSGQTRHGPADGGGQAPCSPEAKGALSRDQIGGTLSVCDSAVEARVTRLRDSKHVTFWRRHVCGELKEDGWPPGVRDEGRTGRAHGIFHL